MSALLQNYHALLDAGDLQPDAAQAAAVNCLDDLTQALGRWQPRRSWLARKIFLKANSKPRGLYIFGPVGRGKTMLMDLFFETAPVSPKSRVHFHAFMVQVHELIFAARNEVKGDPIPQVAKQLAAQSSLLCFDELHVTDITDAMILGRLFEALFAQDVVVVATANAAPNELYKDGLNRKLFEPFIDLIEAHLTVFELTAAKDYRLDKLVGRQLYFTPADSRARAQLDRLWDILTGGAIGASMQLELKGRHLDVPLAYGGVARFDFADLCQKPLGTLDYLAIAQKFHTVLIDTIPVLLREKRNEARRFINLIDTLYDHGITLAVSAQAEPQELYTAGDGAEFFLRTVSRLMEMRSKDYVKARQQRAGTKTWSLSDEI